MLTFEPATWGQFTSIFCLLLILIPAAISDYQRQQVPNWLTMTGWVVAPIIAGTSTGMTGVGDSLLGLALMVALLLPFWMINWFGAADVKLIGTVGAFVGVQDSFLVLMGIVLTGVLLSLLLLIYNGLCVATLRALMRDALRVVIRNSGGSVPFKSGHDVASERLILPYAIPIAVGTMLSVLYMHL